MIVSHETYYYLAEVWSGGRRNTCIVLGNVDKNVKKIDISCLLRFICIE